MPQPRHQWDLWLFRAWAQSQKEAESSSDESGTAPLCWQLLCTPGQQAGAFWKEILQLNIPFAWTCFATSSGATTECSQEVFTELRCHLHWCANTQEAGQEPSVTGKKPALLQGDLLHLDNYGNKSCSLSVSTPSWVLKWHMWSSCCILIILPFRGLAVFHTVFSR